MDNVHGRMKKVRYVYDYWGNIIAILGKIEVTQELSEDGQFFKMTFKMPILWQRNEKDSENARVYSNCQ